MNKLSCNVGDKFGEWTVIEPNCASKNGHTYVKCQCSCGEIKEVNLTALVRGRTSKCKKCSARSRTPKITIGSRYKHFTVIEGPIYKNHTAYYKCRCDCGREVMKLPVELKYKHRDFQCFKCT